MFKLLTPHLVPALAAGIIGSSALLASSAPAGAAEANALFARLKESGAPIVHVQGRARLGGVRAGFRGRGLRNRGFARRGFYGRPRYGYRRGYGYPRYGYGYRRGYGGAAVLGGLAAGALVGSALSAQAASPGYVGTPGYAGPSADAVAYCSRKFKSYDPARGSYLGYDGERHACP